MSNTGNGFLINFLEDSENFVGITFAGCFNIDINHLQVIYDHYQKTGKNHLDDYCQVKYAIWDGKPPQTDPFSDNAKVLDRDEYNNFRVAVSNMRRIRLFELEQLRQIEYWAKIKHESYKDWKSDKIKRKRSMACTYTSKPQIRGKIFKKYGEECLACSSNDNLTLDHIRPVSRGGQNEIANLQPLCKSCNSAKGTKIIDYRG